MVVCHGEDGAVSLSVMADELETDQTPANFERRISIRLVGGGGSAHEVGKVPDRREV